MTNSPYVRSAQAEVALELAPPLVRRTLFEEARFQEQYGFIADAVLSISDLGVSFQRSDLYKAIRKIVSGESRTVVTDTGGDKWTLKNKGKKGELPVPTLSRRRRSLTLLGFAALSSDRNIRLLSLDKAASDVNLPSDAKEVWRIVLAERALEDEEIDRFQIDIRNNPIVLPGTIRKEITEGEIDISALIPLSRRYYERLVGVFDGSKSIQDYAINTGKSLFDQLSEWQAYDGFLFSLFLSAHPALSAEISTEHLNSEDLLRAFNFLEKHGDRTSQIGAVEIGLRILSTAPEIEPIIKRIIEQIRDDDINGQGSGFKLFSALFILVDGELSRSRLFSSEPPFYRRLASLSQAALINRQIMNIVDDLDKFCEWAFINRGEQYYMQSLADMRLEPRWNPDQAEVSQMKADFFGRIMNAARKYENNIKEGELFDLILTDKPGSLQSKSDLLQPYLPGPLEGAIDSQIILPPEIAEAIDSQLSAEEVGPSSFIALVNSALLFRVDIDRADFAAKVLKLGNYRITDIKNRQQLLTILNGLAIVAAISRSHVLADELRILVRRYRNDAQYALSMDEVIRMCLVSAASRADPNDWREFAGDCLTELAFSNLDGDDGKMLHSHLLCLCHAVPGLWVFCGRADAALKAYNACNIPT